MVSDEKGAVAIVAAPFLRSAAEVDIKCNPFTSGTSTTVIYCTGPHLGQETSTREGVSDQRMCVVL